jgi:ATP-dependent helicase/nuclease subunit B
MAQQGAFGPELRGEVTELNFWKLSGRSSKGEDRPIFPADPVKVQAIIATAAERLPLLLQKFGKETTPYLAKPHPGRGTYHDKYHGVSRRGEWGGEESAGESERRAARGIQPEHLSFRCGIGG